MAAPFVELELDGVLQLRVRAASRAAACDLSAPRSRRRRCGEERGRPGACPGCREVVNARWPTKRTMELHPVTRGAAAPFAATLVIAALLAAPTHAQGLPAPEDSGIEHVVVVMMENRSFDHFLGWLPQADGRQEGLVYLDENGVPHETIRLSPDYQGCDHPDPDHSYEGGRIELNGGACDGWLLAGDNDEYSIGFYKRNDLRFFARAARDWTTCDRYFSSILAETWPNNIYAFSGQTDRLVNSFELCTLPTIWDRMEEAGMSAR
jgi:phospholipase C